MKVCGSPEIAKCFEHMLFTLWSQAIWDLEASEFQSHLMSPATSAVQNEQDGECCNAV